MPEESSEDIPSLWPYQGRYYLKFRNELTELLRSLHPKLSHRSFFVAYSEVPPDGYRLIMVPCAGEEYMKRFDNVPADTKHFMSLDPENNVTCTDPGEDVARQFWIQKRGIRKAILKAVENPEVVTFCSTAKEQVGHDFFMIVQIPAPAFRSLELLSKSEYRLPDASKQVLRRSYTESLIHVFLDTAREKLNGPYAGRGFSNLVDSKRVRADAGKYLARTAEVAGGNLSGYGRLFDSCTTLATLKYEGEEGTGGILIAKKDHPHIEVVSEFVYPVAIDQYQLVRKLLQLASSELRLLCDGYEVFGLGRVKESYPEEDESIFRVQFNKQMHWTLLHGEKSLMHVAFGKPSLKARGFPEESFRSDLSILFGLSEESIDRLVGIGHAVMKQHHGCMVLISPEAEAEVDRLKSQATPVHPFRLEPHMLAMFTSMDGAVVVDCDAICLGIGVILDGVACDDCDPGRGSRYNSALRYVYMKEKKCFAIVKSEDGMLDVIPTFRSRVRRSAIREVMQNLKSLSESSHVEPYELHDVMEWLYRYEFYLLPDQCKEIRRLEMEIKKRFDGSLYVEYPDLLQGNPDLTDFYFSDD